VDTGNRVDPPVNNRPDPLKHGMVQQGHVSALAETHDGGVEGVLDDLKARSEELLSEAKEVVVETVQHIEDKVEGAVDFLEKKFEQVVEVVSSEAESVKSNILDSDAANAVVKAFVNGLITAAETLTKLAELGVPDQEAQEHLDLVQENIEQVRDYFKKQEADAQSVPPKNEGTGTEGASENLKKEGEEFPPQQT